ncbi:MAG: CpaF family protein [Chloroflexi bacterium]|nr:CpaF family protein [Chloroflexota bacterium]
MSLLKRIEQSKTPSPETETRGAALRTGRPADKYANIREKVQAKVIEELDPRMDLSKTAEIRATIQEIFSQVLQEENTVLTRAERTTLFDQLSSEILGLGPIEPLIRDETITEIMINGPFNVYVERHGKIEKTDLQFDDEEHLMRIIQRIVSPIGRRVDESQPYVDARLPDGSRVNIIIPPLSIIGPVVTIRLFSKTPFSMDDLIAFGTFSPEVAEFAQACVQARLNIIVSGGTGSGKTTTLNVLSGFIPNDERIVTIENAAELQLQQEHVVSLESRLPNIEGKGEVSIRDLVINTLRMRPDRIVVGEVRGGEALDMLQAMNTGHDGGLTTLHANSPRDALSRLETMVLMAGSELPHRAIREQIASAIHVIFHQERMRDGTRRIVSVTEVQGMEGEIITLQDIFTFEQTGMEGGKVQGRVRPTGNRPKFTDLIERSNILLSPEIFGYDWRGNRIPR